MAPSTRRTPARSGRSRAQGSAEPPPIPLGHSTAYGAPGRPDLPMPDLSSMLNPQPIESALRQAKRTAQKTPSPSPSVEEEEEEVPMPPPARQNRRKPARVPASRATSIAEDFESVPNGVTHSIEHRRELTAASLQDEGTSIAPVLGYDERQAQLRRERNARRSASSSQHSSVGGDKMAAEPWNVTVLLHSLPRYFKNTVNRALHVASSKWAIALVFLLLLSSNFGLFDKIPLSRKWTLRRARIARGARVMLGMEEFERTPGKYEQAWHYFKYQYMLTEDDFPDWNMPEMQWAYNIQFLTRIENLEKRTTALEQSVESLTNQIRDELPKLTVVRLEDGEFHVPDGFWLALHSKMTGDDSLWKAFLDANEENLKEYSEQIVGDQLALGEKRSTVVSRVMLEDIIRENYDKFLADFRSKMDHEHKDLVSHIQKVASQVAADLIARHTAGQIPMAQQAANRAGSDFIANHVDEIHSINYFSPYHGARVWYELTSPTAIRKQPSWFAQKWAEYYYPPNKPHTALRAWKEVTEAWCAARSSSPGKAQIAVWTGRPVVPRELVVEHIPRSGTLEIATAPREVELWMDVGSDDMVSKIKQTIEEEVSTYDRIECSREAPMPGAICVGRGIYDIHDDNWVQSMPTMKIFDDYKIKSDKFVVRATSNWGGDHTCFYRLRLKGDA